MTNICNAFVESQYFPDPECSASIILTVLTHQNLLSPLHIYSDHFDICLPSIFSCFIRLHHRFTPTL